MKLQLAGRGCASAMSAHSRRLLLAIVLVLLQTAVNSMGTASPTVLTTGRWSLARCQRTTAITSLGRYSAAAYSMMSACTPELESQSLASGNDSQPRSSLRGHAQNRVQAKSSSNAKDQSNNTNGKSIGKGKSSEGKKNDPKGKSSADMDALTAAKIRHLFPGEVGAFAARTVTGTTKASAKNRLAQTTAQVQRGRSRTASIRDDRASSYLEDTADTTLAVPRPWYDPRRLLGTQSTKHAGLRVGAWNVQSLGAKKAKNRAIMMTLAEVISRYDIMSVLEVRDGSGREVADAVLQALEVYCRGLKADPRTAQTLRARDCQYEVVVSPRLGGSAGTRKRQTGEQSSYKEQVAVFYRTNRVRPIESRVSDEPRPSVFKSLTGWMSSGSKDNLDPISATRRPPFLTVFEQITTKRRVLIMSVHFSPTSVASEMESAARSYRHEIRRAKDIDSALIIGDFKPLGSTTTDATRDLIYDRVVVGRPYANTIIPSSARILRWPNSFDARAVTERWEQGGGDMACASVKEMRRHGGRRKSVLATGSTRRFREHAGKEGALDAWTWARIVSDHLPVEIQLDLERTK